MSRTTRKWAMLASTTAIIAIASIAGAGARAQSASSVAPSGVSQGAVADDASKLRVCADPNYLPFSNTAGEGFENKVAALLAKSMGRKLEYTWASYRGQGGFPNFLADNLQKHKCDVIMDLPYGDGEEGFTDAYYTSSYVFISRKDKNYGIHSMSMPVMRSIKIGYEEGTTPETALKMLNLLPNAVVYHISEDATASPEQLLQAVQDNKVGVMVTWKPAIGGFLNKFPDLVVTGVPTEEYGPGIPQVSYTYKMAIGVRPDDTNLKAALNDALKANKTQIASVLADYKVGVDKPPASNNWVNQ